MTRNLKLIFILFDFKCVIKRSIELLNGDGERSLKQN